MSRDKHNFAVPSALFALAVIAAFALNTTAIAQAPPGSLWYNGDFNGVNGLANERNTIVSQASVYDDFNVTGGPMWNVTAVFSDDLITTVVTGADWEIRTGVSAGNGGTLVATGTTNSPVVTPTGRSGFGFTEYMVEVTGLNVFLPMLPSDQHYWLNVTPVGNGTGRSFNSTTSGANCVGTPCGNDQNAFFNSAYMGIHFQPISDDFSNGVIGTVVPEPATVALLSCGLGILLIALRRRRATRRTLLCVTAAALAINMSADAQAPPGSLWYNGDFNGVSYHANGRNTSDPPDAVHDDFNVTGAWNVAAVFSDNLLNTVVTGADWTIRSGCSPGNGCTLVASGFTTTPTVTPTGRSGFGYTEYMVEVTGLHVNLAPGTYWLSVTPVGNGTGHSFNTTTSGANCVGTPCGNDGMSFFDSGVQFSPNDFSMGVIGTVVPEPATVGLLALGVGTLLIPSCRSRGKRRKRL